MRRNREAEILAKTYTDRMTVYRKHPGRDPETQETVEKEEIVYENICCGFSQSSNDTPDRQEFHSEAKRGAVIFTMPGIELSDRDRVVIVTEAGQTFEGITGKTFGYASHGETAFKAEKIT